MAAGAIGIQVEGGGGDLIATTVPLPPTPPLDLPYPTHSHMLQYATISRQHTYCDIPEPEIDDSFRRKDDETGGATTL